MFAKSATAPDEVVENNVDTRVGPLEAVIIVTTTGVVLMVALVVLLPVFEKNHLLR